MTVHETSHVVAKPWPAEFQIKDEIYQYRHFDPKSVRVIYSLNMAKCKTKMPYHVPVCWVREFGKGRLFYTNLGHNDATWKDAKFHEHLLAGIKWATKLIDGPATPNPARRGSCLPVSSAKARQTASSPGNFLLS